MPIAPKPLAPPVCRLCGKPRERETWLRCNACERKAGDKARRRLAAANPRQWERAVKKAARGVARIEGRDET